MVSASDSARSQVMGETSRLGATQGERPAQLHTGATVSARATEIQALLRMMASSRANQTTRAWQQLPRELRRRAASHNVLRLPRRLRGKALREMQASKTEARSRSALRKRMANFPATAGGRRREQLRDRAARPGARWLETHRWHAKRFHMTRGVDDKRPAHHRLKPNQDPASESLPIGLTIAQTPHQKSHRTTWRAASEAVVVHDASYTAWFRLDSHPVGRQAGTQAVSAVLQAASINNVSHSDSAATATSPKDELLLSGSYAYDTTLLAGPPPTAPATGASINASKPLARLVAPVTLLRFSRSDGASATLATHPALRSKVSELLHAAIRSTNSDTLVNLTSMASAPHPSLAVPNERSSLLRIRNAHKKLRPAEKKREGAQASGQPTSARSATQRRQEIRRALKFWAGKGPNVARQWHRRGFAQSFTGPIAGPDAGWNTFMLTGPGAGRLIGAVLTPVAGTSTQDSKTLQLIAQTLAPAQVPRGFVLPLQVQDPRLAYPPKLPTNQPLAERNAFKRAKDEFGRSQPGPRPRSRKRKRQNIVQHDQGDDQVPNAVQEFNKLVQPGLDLTQQPTTNNILSTFFLSSPEVPRFTQGDIDARRASAAGGLVRGATVSALERDQSVPVLLIRTDTRTRGVAPTFSSSGLDQSALAQGGARAKESDASASWTLLVPRGWGMAFWRSLVHPHTRVAAQDAVAHLALDARTPSFPQDFVAPLHAQSIRGQSDALVEHPFAQVWRTRALVARREWQRHPPGKRSAQPPDADANRLLSAAPQAGEGHDEVSSRSLVSAAGPELYPHHAAAWQSAASMARARALGELPLTILPGLDHALDDVTPWLLRVESTDTQAWLQLAYALFSPQAHPTPESTNLTRALHQVCGTSFSSTEGLAEQLASAFILVHIECVRKGNLHAPASVLMAPQFQDHKWRSALHQLALDGRDESAKQALDELEFLVPPAPKAHKPKEKDEPNPVSTKTDGSKAATPRGKGRNPPSRIAPHLLAERQLLGTQDARIGILTSAGFSLTHGRAHGIGTISLLALCHLYIRDQMYLPAEGARRGRNPVTTDRLVAVQNGPGQPRRAATLVPLVV